jgi:hypothetical protein
MTVQTQRSPFYHTPYVEARRASGALHSFLSPSLAVHDVRNGVSNGSSSSQSIVDGWLAGWLGLDPIWVNPGTVSDFSDLDRCLSIHGAFFGMSLDKNRCFVEVRFVE